jgi:hypothetical protein
MVFGALNSIKAPPPAKTIIFGNNWANSGVPAQLRPASFLGIGMSGLGQYQVAPIYNSTGIYVSNNYGATWTLNSSVVDGYYDAYISYSGRYVFVPTYTNKMYKSTNFGVSFTLEFSSSRPKLYYFSQDETYHGYISSTNVLNISSNSGTSFTSSLSSIVGACFSQNGQYQLAVSSTNINVSSNYGASYTSIVSGLTSLSEIAMSLDGKYMFALTSTVLKYSSDFGATWNDSTGVTGANDLQCNDTGRYVSLKTTTDVYVSSNFGVSFTSKYNSTNIWNKEISLDGKYLIVTKNTTTQLEISNDYGETWITRTTGIPASASTNYIFPKLSTDGRYMMLGTNIGTAGFYNYVYVSAN